MSALPSIADICSAQAHVCFVPIADIAARSTCLKRCRAAVSLDALDAKLLGPLRQQVIGLRLGWPDNLML